MKKSIFAFLSFLLSINVFAQDCIVTADNKTTWAKIISETETDVLVSSNGINRKIKKDKIKLIEYEENGITVFNDSLINEIDGQTNYGQGCCIYVQYSSPDNKLRENSRDLREMLREQGFWKIVDCPEESSLTIALSMDEDEDDDDYNYLNIFDKDSNLIFRRRFSTNTAFNASSVMWAAPWKVASKIREGINEMKDSKNYIQRVMPSIEEFQCESDPNILEAEEVKDIFAKGNKAFVRVGITKESFIGGSCISDLLKKDRFWNVARCPKEANFIIEFMYSEEGRDHAYLVVRNKKDKVISWSSNISCDSNYKDLSDAGEKLYSRFLKKLQKK